ncbi:MAG: DoxX family protein [Nocardia sp.]|nr:DoxX family protein [Nocardia sp.]
MSDKPNPSSEPNAPADQPTVSGRAGGSPYDNPTGELPTVEPAANRGVPRTDDDLGLDPEVPAADSPTVSSARASAGRSTAAPGAESAGGAAYSFATIPPAPGNGNGNGNGKTERLRRPREYRRGTVDLGLLCLRLTVGLTFLYHGLQKLAGWFDGPGLDGTRHMLEHGGWKHIEVSTAMLATSEVGGGALIVLGLATPLAAGAVLASIADAWLWKQGMASGFQYKPVELETILAALAGTLILTGPGRLSFDRNRGWAVRPAAGSFLVLILALVAAALGWIFLHGGNPFTGFF